MISGDSYLLGAEPQVYKREGKEDRHYMRLRFADSGQTFEASADSDVLDGLNGAREMVEAGVPVLVVWEGALKPVRQGFGYQLTVTHVAEKKTAAAGRK